MDIRYLQRLGMFPQSLLLTRRRVLPLLLLLHALPHSALAATEKPHIFFLLIDVHQCTHNLIHTSVLGIYTIMSPPMITSPSR